MIKYCKRCCLPSTKPHLSFDEEGICNACRNYENRKSVDWDERKAELMEILDRYRSKDHSNWDCIIPVSGGKDSTYQVITMLELGMNPLCVTATTCDLTPIGEHREYQKDGCGLHRSDDQPCGTCEAQPHRTDRGRRYFLAGACQHFHGTGAYGGEL